MVGSGGEREGFQRVTREEMFPKVGEPTDVLRALVPTFTEKLVDAVVDSLKNGGAKRVELELIGSGEKPQTLRVKIEREGEGGLLAVRMEGDWKNKPDIPEGLPVTADYVGKFWRFRSPNEPDPIAEVGMILSPRDAFAMATRGKTELWLLRLSGTRFPNGGRITAFTHPNGADVEKGKSTLLFVEPL